MNLKYNLCKTENGCYFIEKLEDNEYAYLRTDMSKKLEDCIEIFKSIKEFGLYKNNWCETKQPQEKYNVIKSFNTIDEIENFKIIIKTTTIRI